jgi:DNA-binding transcriptional MerR regulator
MFSIGEFGRHGRVSVRMLRHYDAIGLLRPACVDPATGYRFYQASQLAELNRIIALRDLGFTLQQVQAILEEKVSAAELRGMLKLRRAEIHAQIEAETTRLARVEARLLTIEDEARVPADGVVVERLAIRTPVTMQTLGTVVPPLTQEVFAWLGQQDGAPAGPPFGKYDVIDMAGRLEVEAGAPVPRPLAGHGRWLRACCRRAGT